MTTELPTLKPCRWRGRARGDAYACDSPAVVKPDGVVPAALCAECGLADHAPPDPAAGLPCARLGGPTGERVLCPGCRGHVEVKLFSCAAHGRCTTHKALPGVACCEGCPDRQPLLAVRLWRGLGDAVHFAHLAQLYRRRGYAVGANFDHRLEPVFRAAGVPWCEGGAGLSWSYRAGFNKPEWDVPWSGNQPAAQLNAPPLPHLGPTAGLWDELCAVSLDGTLTDLLADEHRDWARELLDGLPRPVVLVHTHGHSYQPAKNLPAATVTGLWDGLLAAGLGVLILDLDGRTLRSPHPHLRHLRQGGRPDLYQLAALYDEAALLVGIDSGPYHLAGLTRTPCLGVFHGHHPSCVGLPRARTVNLCRRHPVNACRAERWNLAEYEGDMPAAAEIIGHAKAMLGENPWTLRP